MSQAEKNVQPYLGSNLGASDHCSDAVLTKLFSHHCHNCIKIIYKIKLFKWNISLIGILSIIKCNELIINRGTCLLKYDCLYSYLMTKCPFRAYADITGFSSSKRYHIFPILYITKTEKCYHSLSEVINQGPVVQS